MDGHRGDWHGEVRIGDIFAQLVEYYGSMNDHHSAYRTVERMRQRGIAIWPRNNSKRPRKCLETPENGSNPEALTPFLDRSLLETIYRSVGQPLPDEPGGPNPLGEECEEEIPED